MNDKRRNKAPPRHICIISRMTNDLFLSICYHLLYMAYYVEYKNKERKKKASTLRSLKYKFSLGVEVYIWEIIKAVV